MSVIKAYYPFVLYAIPYLIAAYVLIKAKRQRMCEAREKAIVRYRIAEVAEPPKSMPQIAPKSIAKFGTRSITKVFQKIVSRKAA